MSTIKTIIYNTPNMAEFIHDANEVEIDVSGARLKLMDNVSQLFNQDFSSDVGFTYDSALADFSAGAVSQVDQSPVGSRLAGSFTGFNADWNKDDVVTGFLNGTPTIVSSKLQCFTGAVRGLYYDTVSSKQGAIKTKYTPNYTGGPATNINVVGFQNGVSTPHRFVLTHSPSGNNFRLTINNNIGTTVFTAQVIGAAWLPTAGQEYEIEINWDSVTGTTQIFIDGVLHGTRNDPAWAMNDGDPVRLYLGANPSIYNTANATYDDLIFFNTVQHTAGYTPGYVVPLNLYATSLVILPLFNYPGVGVIQSIQSLAVSEVGAPRYIIEGDYWDGAAWSASDGSYAQASSLATVNANIAALDVLSASDILVQIVFNNDSSPSSVSDLTVTYTGQTYAASSIIEPTDTSLADSLDDLSDDSVIDTNSRVNYVIKIEGLFYWITGSTLTISDKSFAQSNTIAELVTDKQVVTDFIANGAKIVMCPVLYSGPSMDEQAEVISTTLSHGFYAVPVGCDQCTLFGFINDNCKEVTTGTVRVFVDEPFLSQGNLVSFDETVALRTPNGYFELDLIIPSEGTQYKFEAEWTDADGDDWEYEANILIPDANSVIFTDAVVIE